MPYKRLFAAIKIMPPIEFIDRLNNFKIVLNHDKISWANFNQLHLTLHFFGETNEELIPEIENCFADIACQTRNFSIVCNNTGIFGNKHSPKVLWLAIEKNAELIDLKTKINNKLEDNNFKTEPLKFIPHISLARIKKIEDSKYFNQLLDKFKNFDKFTQVVEEFYLFESILTAKGAVHNILKTFSIK